MVDCNIFIVTNIEYPDFHTYVSKVDQNLGSDGNKLFVQR